LAARDGEQDDADGLARLALQPRRSGARRGGDLRRAFHRYRPRAPDRGAPPGGRPSGHGLRRDLPELQRLQRRRLRHRARAEGERGVRLLPDASAEIVDVADVGEDALLVHDEHARTPSLAAAIARLSHTPHGPTPIGVFRDVERPVYDRLMDEQLAKARADQGEGDLAELLHAGDTWTIR